MYTKDKLINQLDMFLKYKNTTKSTKKDYKVDCMSFINWYLLHKHLPDRLLYRAFLKSLDNSELSEITKRRRRIVVGEYLVYIGCYSSSHLIVKSNDMVKYYDLINSEIFLNGEKVFICDE